MGKLVEHMGQLGLEKIIVVKGVEKAWETGGSSELEMFRK
jgi:hypothetical protein